MKKIILSLALILSLSATTFAQKALVDNPITYEQIEDVNDNAQAKRLTNHGITQYTASNGAVVRLGDKLSIGKPQDNAQAFVSVQVKPLTMGLLGYNFNHSTNVNGTDPSIVTTEMNNTEHIVRAFYVVGTKKEGYKALVELETCSTCINLIADVELGIKNKEITAIALTPDQALLLLKAEQDKLDAKAITQEQFDAKEAELIKYINRG